MGLRALNCENCGAPIDWDGSYGKAVKCDHCGTTFIPAATDTDEIWSMTDPVARARYQVDGRLDKLEHDIRYEVLRGQDWSELDRTYLSEITRLEADGFVRKLASFWAISPHPPVYRALKGGEIVLGSDRVQFQQGEEIIWACPMTRDRFNLELPVLIGDFQDTTVQRICGKMMNAMQGRMG